MNSSLKNFQEYCVDLLKNGVSETCLPFVQLHSKQSPGIFFIHGSKSSPIQLKEISEYFYSQGYNIYSHLVDGHGQGVEELNSTSYEKIIRQTETQFQWFQKLCGETSLLGYSLGGCIALCISSQEDIKRIVISTPSVVEHLRYRRITPFKLVIKDLILHTAENIKTMNCPVLVMHSLDDSWVYWENAHFLFQNFSSRNKKLIGYQGVSHHLPLSHLKHQVYLDIIQFLQADYRENTVNFFYKDSSADSVFIAGTFTDWDKNKIPMLKKEKEFFAELSLQPGDYQYKLIVDGQWILDPNAPSVEGDYGMNSLLRLS